jgi:FBD
LEKVIFQAYVGSSTELDLAKFLLSRAKVLKVLKIAPRWDEWTAKMHCDLLRVRNEFSPNTRVYLATEKRPFGQCFSPAVTNLSVRDPFGCLMENLQLL